MNTLEGKVALITGGTKGIGYGIAQALLEQGMRVAITGRTLENAIIAAESLGIIGETTLAIESNVTQYESQEEAVKQIVEKWGQLDVLIANAGVGHFESITDLSIDQWKDTIDTNLT